MRPRLMRRYNPSIIADGGQALAALSSGNSSPDSDIATLLANAENTSRAAVPAKAALPNVKAQLEAARAQVPGLEEQRRIAERDFPGTAREQERAAIHGIVW